LHPYALTQEGRSDWTLLDDVAKYGSHHW
jgi:hypothetical protein